MEQLNQIAEKINSMSLRERAMVFAGIVFVIFSVWDSFLIKPLEAEQKKLVAELTKQNAERIALNTRLQELLKTKQDDPNAANLKKLKTLRSKLIDLQAEIESSTSNLVSPKDMPKVLETVLHKTGGLTLTSLKSLGVKPLVASEGPEAKNNVDKTESEKEDKQLTAENIDNAYRHGLRIEFIGDYLTTLSYLKSLEELDWGFFWDNFQLAVSEYPDANASIEIFTLSLRKEWIGV